MKSKIRIFFNISCPCILNSYPKVFNAGYPFANMLLLGSITRLLFSPMVMFAAAPTR
ncbi:MAG: hypothetical protein IPG85_10280 [Bacteroidetes bacterium]|nr:hypothetical protein [Bacteroidota bacterium]